MDLHSATAVERSSRLDRPTGLNIPGYTLQRLIAEGATASVYLATQNSVGRTVALKVLDKLDNVEQSARFLAEGELIAGLSHRHINTLFDVGRVGDHHYLAMEYLDGGSLTERIERGLRLSTALDIVEHLAACLAFLHDRGIVHRDVKPANILFHADGTPKLTDFGIAKQLDRDQQLTLDGTALGSPYYLSPEQATGQPIDGRSDIYSLGVVCFEMLTGDKPFSENSHVQTIVAHINQPVPTLPEHLAAYQPLIDRMMAKEPEGRFGSAAELLGFIRGLRLANPERPPVFWQAPAFALASVALLLVVLITTFALWPASPPAPTPAIASTADAVAEPAALAPPLEPPAATPIPVITPETPAAPPEQVEPAAPAAPANPIADWLASAETAFQQNRLTLPADDNALRYYKQVLETAPDHPTAKAGIERIVARYQGMANRALDQGEPVRAQRLARRGLNIDPGHPGLQQTLSRAETMLARNETPPPAAQQTAARPAAAEPNPVDGIKDWWRRNFMQGSEE